MEKPLPVLLSLLAVVLLLLPTTTVPQTPAACARMMKTQGIPRLRHAMNS